MSVPSDRVENYECGKGDLAERARNNKIDLF